MTPTLLRSVICRACRRFTVRTQRACFSATSNPLTVSPGEKVRIVEVGPRDGLQNEKTAIPLATKIELIERLVRTGVSNIEAGSFVAPKWVPQMANSSEVLKHLLKNETPAPGPVTYSLVPNQKGMSNMAQEFGKHPGSFSTQMEPITMKPTVEVAIFAAATEIFTEKNLNCDIKTSLEQFRAVIQDAKGLGLRVRAYISVALGCPYEGFDVDPGRVAEIAKDLLEAGADEISLGDTTGTGTAPRTLALLHCMTAAGVRNEDIAVHFHDTYGQALVNLVVALEYGIRTVDSSVGGLGGCPYSPGATGNVASENVFYFLETLGYRPGVDLAALVDVGTWITAQLGKANGSVVAKAVLGAREHEKGTDGQGPFKIYLVGRATYNQRRTLYKVQR